MCKKAGLPSMVWKGHSVALIPLPTGLLPTGFAFLAICSGPQGVFPRPAV